MHFLLLGPLDVAVEGRSLPLTGVKQRLALAFLLLHGNALVSAKELLSALWPDEEPATARKVLHNAISGIRKLLREHDDGQGSPMLLTKAPGYQLHVPPENIDLIRFRTLAQGGHAALTAGRWEQSARTLSQALDLWRGPVLSDLVERGADWPEIAAVRNARLSALEDRIEAELHLGRHRELLGELEMLVAREPSRERLSAQLMCVLYHRGRQADALQVYRRTRDALIEHLGLDPSPEFQSLERAILNHEMVPMHMGAVQPRSLVTTTAEARRRTEELESDEIRQVSLVLVAAGPVVGGTLNDRDLELVRTAVGAVVEREARRWDVCVVDDETGHELLKRAGQRWRAAAGTSSALVWLAWTGLHRAEESDAWRALQVARGVLGKLTIERSQRAGCGGVPPCQVRAVVVTGEAHLCGTAERRWPTLPDAIVRLCLRLLESDAPGSIRTCPTTAEAVRLLKRLDHLPFIAREQELGTLDGVLSGTRTHRQPHLVTVFGDAGMGRSRLVTEWARLIRSEQAVTCLIECCQPPINETDRRATMANLVRAAAGITPDCSGTFAAVKLAEQVDELIDERRSAWVLAHLNDLLGFTESSRSVPVDAFDAWTVFFESLAAKRPLVLIVEDLHLADDVVIDFLDHLTTKVGGVPLMVVATSRPEFLEQRSQWGGGRSRGCSMRLSQLSEADTAKLLWNAYTSGADLAPTSTERRWSARDLRGVAGTLSGNPLFAMEYGRLLRELEADDVTLAEVMNVMPYSVRSRLALLVDTLPSAAREVLYNAALFGDQVTETGLAAVAADADERATGRWLRYLEHREVLRRVGPSARRAEPEYEFTSPQLQAIARARVPETVWARRQEARRRMHVRHPAPRKCS